MECLWDLFGSIPSLYEEGRTVLGEARECNKNWEIDSKHRLWKQGFRPHDESTMGVTPEIQEQVIKMMLTEEDQLEDVTIEQWFSPAFFQSQLWYYWSSMLPFQPDHSLIEMRRYAVRFMHQLHLIRSLWGILRTKYDQYSSLIRPLEKYLADHGVRFVSGAAVTDMDIRIEGTDKTVTALHIGEGAGEGIVPVADKDLVFFTNGSNCSNATIGDHHTAPGFDTSVGDSWKMWQNIARQDPSFGHPDEFLKDPELTQWESATLTTLDEEIIPYMEAICKRDVRSGKVATGGIVTARDSGWLMSWTVNRQPHFKVQPKDQCVVWIYGLYTSRMGDYVKKRMRDCTGEEIAREWLYHIGVPVERIDELAAKSCNCVPVMMPRVTTYFICRKKGDRPDVVPNGVVNFAFLGNHAETFRDTVFTTEYSVRTAMEAVYTLCHVDRGVPEVFNSVYDVRVLMQSTKKLMDGRRLTDMKLPLPKFITKPVIRAILKKVDKTEIGTLLRRYDMVDFDL